MFVVNYTIGSAERNTEVIMNGQHARAYFGFLVAHDAVTEAEIQAQMTDGSTKVLARYNATGLVEQPVSSVPGMDTVLEQLQAINTLIGKLQMDADQIVQLLTTEGNEIQAVQTLVGNLQATIASDQAAEAKLAAIGATVQAHVDALNKIGAPPTPAPTPPAGGTSGSTDGGATSTTGSTGSDTQTATTGADTTSGSGTQPA